MEQRQILVVESDSSFARQIQDALTPYGVQVNVVADGSDGLQQAKSTPPSLILLCVELPNMSGYSICNKLKKNPELKQIPLIIMSSEATPDIFEQHKKLKTRAEDYLIKPFAMEELVEKMGHLIELPVPEPDTLDPRATREYQPMEVELGADEEIELSAEEFEVDEAYMSDEPTQMVDQEISMATDAAFAALEMMGANPPDEEATRRANAMELLLPSEAAVEEGMQTEGEPMTAPPVEALDVAGGDQNIELETSTLAQKVLEESPAAEPHDAIDADLDDFDTAESSSLDTTAEVLDLPEPQRVQLDEPEEIPAPQAPPNKEAEALQHRVEELERENRRLDEELRNSAVLAPAEGGGLSRDRELLGLREVINKKEKEILDLRDDVDSKERQILDHKDKVRELERRARDMEEKLLAVEREMLSVNERLAALVTDKEKLQQRESGVKARLSEAKEEIDKAYAEIDDLKQRFEEEVDRLATEHKSQLTGEQDRHAGVLERAKVEHEEAEQQLRQEHSAALEQVAEQAKQAAASAGEDKQQALEQVHQDFESQMAELQEQHDKEMQALRTSHQENIASLQVEHEQKLEDEQAAAVAQQEEQRIASMAALEELEQQNARTLEGVKSEHDQALEQLRAEHAEEIGALNGRHREQREEQDAQHAGEKEALRTEHQGELERLRQDHRQEKEQLEQDHQDRVAGMESRHRAQQEELEGGVRERDQRIAEMEQQIAEMEQSFVDTKEQMEQGFTDTKEQMEQSHSATREQLAQSEERGSGLEHELEQARGQIGEQVQVIRQHEQQAEAYQDQLMKAFTKIRNDEALAEKAKRAMAVALTLLEEQKKLSTADGEESQPQDQPQ